MRLGHFEALAPCCPVCFSLKEQAHPLAVTSALSGSDDQVLEGSLGCTNLACQHEYPIIDGIPFILGNVRSYVSQNILQIVERDDLAERTESLLGDCCGPGSTYDTVRQQVSSYVWDHYADLDSQELSSDWTPGSVVKLLGAALDEFTEPPRGPVIDLGCSVGRTSFELAARTGELVLGVDLNHAMLRVAARALRDGHVTYARRRVGLVYDRRNIPVEFPHVENVDFWACDVTSLPFGDGRFRLATSFNLLDCVQAPVNHLMEIARTLLAGGSAIVVTPYDWSSAATSPEAWLGGHSQRGESRGASEPVLRTLLSGDSSAIANLHLVKELPDQSWQVRMHDRGLMNYQVHGVIARKQ